MEKYSCKLFKNLINKHEYIKDMDSTGHNPVILIIKCFVLSYFNNRKILNSGLYRALMLMIVLNFFLTLKHFSVLRLSHVASEF